MKSDDLISFESCEIISDYIFDYREIKRGQANLQKQIYGGYIQTVIKPRFGQYLIVKKNNVFYLMDIVSGGECTMGTMKFDENTFNLQDVWVKESPNEERFKVFKMKIIDVSRDYDLLYSKIMKIGF